MCPKGFGAKNDSETVTLTTAKKMVTECMRSLPKLWDNCRETEQPSAQTDKVKASEETVVKDLSGERNMAPYLILL